MKKFIFTAAVAVMTLSFSSLVHAAVTPIQPSGAGTWRSPYNISSAENLYWFAEYCNGKDDTSSVYAQLANDITVNDKPVNVNSTENDVEVWTPIMNFGGTFYGKYHTISGLFVRGGEYAGLFGSVKNTATVEDLTIENSFFEGTKYTGAVVGYNEARFLYRCTNKADVRSTASGAYTGGIVGYQAAKNNFADCYNYGDITGTDYTGGIAGAIVPSAALAREFGNFGKVIGTKYAGGIVGLLECNMLGSELNFCYNTGEVYATEYAGGIAGYSDRYFGSSGSSGGGSVMWNVANTISNSYNYGRLSGEHTSGLAGHNGSVGIENCYYLEGTSNDDGYIQSIYDSKAGEWRDIYASLGRSLTAEQFASGEAAYLLNEMESGRYLWLQDIGIDPYPYLRKLNSGLVYYSVLDKKFSNTENPYEYAYKSRGDVNMDENVDITDVIQIMKKAESSDYVMPIEKYLAENDIDIQDPFGDIDGDGSITEADAKMMLDIMVLM